MKTAIKNNQVISDKILEIQMKEKKGEFEFISFEEGYYRGVEHLKKIFSK